MLVHVRHLMWGLLMRELRHMRLRIWRLKQVVQQMALLHLGHVLLRLVGHVLHLLLPLLLLLRRYLLCQLMLNQLLL